MGFFLILFGVIGLFNIVVGISSGNGLWIFTGVVFILISASMFRTKDKKKKVNKNG